VLLDRVSATTGEVKDRIVAKGVVEYLKSKLRDVNSEMILLRNKYHVASAKGERRHIDGRIFRHDNIPHTKWSRVKTFPKHFHFESESNTIESEIPDDPLLAVKYFLNFAKDLLGKNWN
jgi:hypothetical protein